MLVVLIGTVILHLLDLILLLISTSVNVSMHVSCTLCLIMVCRLHIELMGISWVCLYFFNQGLEDN